ncbi:MAG: ABC transporter permease [Candidatus Nezhaarchaeales archaeon]
MRRAIPLVFRLVRGRSIVLALAAFSFSFLFSVTSMGLLGLYNTMTIGMSGGSKCIVVYDFKSSTPLSGIIPLSTVSLLENLSLPLSPEVLVPCLIGSHVVVVRGVVPSCFYNVSELRIVEGEPLLDRDLKAALVGLDVAKMLNVGVGDELLIRSVIADRYVKLVVKGIFESAGPLNGEVIVPLHVGQWLRGLSYSSITLIRIKADGLEEELNNYLKSLFKSETGQVIEASKPRSVYSAYPWIEVKPARAVISSLLAEKFVESYLNRYGLSMDGLIALSAIVALISGVGVYVASSIAFDASRFELEVLRSLGARVKSIKLGFMFKALIIAIPLSIVGFFAAYLLIRMAAAQRLLTIFSYAIEVPLDPILLFLSIALTALLIALSSLRLDV